MTLILWSGRFLPLCKDCKGKKEGKLGYGRELEKAALILKSPGLG